MPVILVTGATGKQGSAVIDVLLDQQKQDTSPILALTRNPSSPGAEKLAAKSPRIKLVQGDLNDVECIFKEAKKVLSQCEPQTHQDHSVWGVFSVQVSEGPGVTVESEVAQGKALIDASIAHGVQHFVYSSVERGGDEASWTNPTPVPHFQSKFQIEQYLHDTASWARPISANKDTGSNSKPTNMGWTILRPVAFMDNLTPGIPTKMFLAAVRNYMGQNGKPSQWVAVKDVGVFAAKAFSKPKEWNKRAVGIAGDELTFEQLSRAFAKATGHPAPATYWFFGSALTYAVKELRVMLEWFVSDGYKADIPARRREHPGLLTMEQWLIRESGFALQRAGIESDGHIIAL
ncbi:hypothetical protein F5Y16DRAFT_359840 [Xylariaceae sp. FL0255]|nr:hypothetical protein F5Y16DRAFT_359840 [Xylariaceae sp. FL0255]